MQQSEATADHPASSIPQRLDEDPEESQEPQQQQQQQFETQSQHSQQSQPSQSQSQRRRPHTTRTESNESRPREATELSEIATASASSYSSASLSSGEYRVAPRQSISTTTSATNAASRKGHQSFHALRRFWSRNVALVVPQKGNRDYFALERTFLAYMRTSAAFSMQGVLIAQLFRLQVRRSTRFDFYTVGVPLSVAYQCCAILIALMGAYRFWRQQNAIARGKAVVGGWEINSMGALTLLAGLVLFALAVAIIVELSKT